MLKCHLSVLNHPSITQFDDISLANHDFDRVVGPDFHNVSGTESRPDLSLQTDFNETYYSVFSQAQSQVYRVTERSFRKLHKDRANSCPDIVQQLNRDFCNVSPLRFSVSKNALVQLTVDLISSIKTSV